ncbi:MAG TPA: FmdB family zinc ribbon protein [Ktedonobacterales bacterium]|nr:FmdB family zinc ribbon protein [Ktedonobacterales bacterium]
MPTYVYRCKSCGHQFEAWQHMTDDPLTTCPQCGSAIHRVVFPTGILFKGSGFYTTDSRKSEATSAPAAASAAESKTPNGASDGSSPDTSAAKTDATGATDTPANTSGTAKESKTPAPAATETKS